MSQLQKDLTFLNDQIIYFVHLMVLIFAFSYYRRSIICLIIFVAEGITFVFYFKDLCFNLHFSLAVKWNSCFIQ